MFSAIEKNETAEILWNGAPLLTGLCPVVRLDDGTCPALTLQTKELETDYARLTWADETITAGLTLSWEEDCLLLRWVLLDHGWSTEENQALVDFQKTL